MSRAAGLGSPDACPVIEAQDACRAFVALWRDADAEPRPVVEAARRRALPAAAGEPRATVEGER
jgi:hypothetical protein